MPDRSSEQLVVRKLASQAGSSISGRQDLNLRPRGPQPGSMARIALAATLVIFYLVSMVLGLVALDAHGGGWQVDSW